MGEVKLYRLWRSPFSWRVELALKLKGVDYEIVEEDLENKSDQLIEYNPIHKKIPVLVHDGKPVLESLVILEYIDEIWKENALLPSDAYGRAHARFWASFVDDKIFSLAGKVATSRGEEQEKAKEEFIEALKIFEKEIEGREVDHGSRVGYLDIVGLWVCYWTPILQEVFGNEILTRDTFPGIYRWSDGLLSHPFLVQNLPNRDQLVATFQTWFSSAFKKNILYSINNISCTSFRLLNGGLLN